MTPLTAQQFAEQITVSRETLAKLEIYHQLLARWNARINLVSRASLADAWRRHFLDSAQLLQYLPPVPKDRDRVMVDLGSGAGFPGLVLACLGVGDVHLVESDQRKAVFLREVARQADVPVTIHCARIERLARFPADLVVSRACAPLTQLLLYSARFAKSGESALPACLFLKGKNLDEELTAAQKVWKMTFESFPSRSDPNGTILRIGIASRADTKS
ncbi:MAG: 16S rRNA (guanine(527)-N(7))-methyltransferase RsmG [Pseudomonadota bacterium]